MFYGAIYVVLYMYSSLCYTNYQNNAQNLSLLIIYLLKSIKMIQPDTARNVPHTIIYQYHPYTKSSTQFWVDCETEIIIFLEHVCTVQCLLCLKIYLLPGYKIIRVYFFGKSVPSKYSGKCSVQISAFSVHVTLRGNNNNPNSGTPFVQYHFKMHHKS